MGADGRGSMAAWGTERVALAPDSTPTNGRNNFFIHGGFTTGSAGCIDLGPNEKAYFDALRSTGEQSHKVVVSYEPSPETSPHPLAGNSFWNGVSEYITRPMPGPASLMPEVQGASPTTPAFQPDAVYSPAGDFFGNFPRVSAVAPTSLASNASGPRFGPQVTNEFGALGRGVERIRGGAGQSIGNGFFTFAETPSLSRPLLRGTAVPNSSVEETAFGDRPEEAPSGPIVARRLSYRVGSAVPSITPRNPNQPELPQEADPPLGVLSGKLMSPWPLLPQVRTLPDNSDASGNGGWFDFPAGIASPSPTQPEPPSDSSKPVRYLGRRIVEQSQPSAFDTTPAVPLVPPDDPYFSGGLLGRLIALAGIDPQNPAQLAPPLMDDQLREFYRDDQAQPWFRSEAALDEEQPQPAGVDVIESRMSSWSRFDNGLREFRGHRQVPSPISLGPSTLRLAERI